MTPRGTNRRVSSTTAWQAARKRMISVISRRVNRCSLACWMMTPAPIARPNRRPPAMVTAPRGSIPRGRIRGRIQPAKRSNT